MKKPEVDVQYLEKLHELHNDLAFLPERMEIEKVEKLVANLHDKTEYVIHIRNLKKALNNGLVLSGLTCLFSKIGKKCPNLGRKYTDCGHLWVKFLI